MHTPIMLSLLAMGVATLSFPMEAHYDRPSQHLHKRAGYPNLYMEGGGFEARVYYSVGSGMDSQRANGYLTTSISEFVIQTKSNPKCSSDPETIYRGNGVNCTYAVDTSASGLSSRQSLYPNSWLYGDGYTNTTIEFFGGDINFNDDIIDSVVIAAITDGLSEARFGVGYPFNSFQAISYNHSTGEVVMPYGYQTAMQQMKAQGLILSQSYSVWLSSLAPGSPGGLALGGFDRMRFDGNLTTLPIEYEWFEYANFTMTTLKTHSNPILVVNSLSITNPSGDDTKIMDGVAQYLLDFDDELSTFPAKLLDILVEMFHCTNDTSAYHYCPCGVPEGYLTFNMRGYEMRVPFSSFILPVRDYKGSWQSQENDGSLRCYLSAVSTPLRRFTIGMGVLTSQYVVVHMETNEIGLASYNGYNSSAYEIFQMGDNEVLSATQAPSYSSSYDLSDSTVRVYTPTFNISMSELYSSTDSPSVSSTGGEATATTTGYHLKDSTMSHVRTVITTINGSPSLIQNPGCVFACIFGLLL